MGGFLALAGAFFFGASHVFIRRGLVEGHIDKMTGLYLMHLVNFLVNAAAFFSIYLIFRPLPAFNLSGLWYFVGAGFLTAYLGRIILLESIERIGASRATGLKITAPFFTVILGIIFLGERFSPWAILGMVLIFGGVYYISRETRAGISMQDYPNLVLAELPVKGGAIEAESLLTPEQGSILKAGLILGILSGLAFGVGNVFRKVGVEHYPLPVAGVAIGTGVALFCMSLQFIWQKRFFSLFFSLRKTFKGGYLWAGFTSSLAQYSIFFALLYSPVSLVNTIKAAESLFTILLGYLLLKDRDLISLNFLKAALAIMAGVAIILLHT